MIETLYLKTLRPSLPPLRVGVLLDRMTVASTVAVVLDHVLSADFIDLALLIMHDPPPAPSSAFPPRIALVPRRLRHALRSDIRPHLLYHLYERCDARLNRDAAHLLEPLDYRAKLAGIDCIVARPITTRFVHRFQDSDVASIRQYDLDVILRFGFNILRGEILNAARYGVWSYHHGDNEFYRGGPPHFWEMVERNPLSGVMLQVLDEQLDSGRVLTKALTPTESFTSVAVNRVAPYTTGHTFIIRKLWELHSYGSSHVDRFSVPSARYQGKRLLYRRPSNVEMVGFALSTTFHVVRNRLRGSDPIAHWQIAARPSVEVAFREGTLDTGGFRWLNAPRGHFYADPFAIRRNGVDWILFEDYDYAERLGRIAAAPWNAEGSLGPVEIILSKPYHLSYPFIWEEDGELYMIPETGSNQTVYLYRCTDFPKQWALERTLFEGPAFDTTVLSHDERLWFFVTLVDRPAAPQLFLFSARSLFDHWSYHPANPISLDVRTARCGGAIGSWCGRLVRPAQDGSLRYGYALRFQEIVRLNEAEYREQPFAILTPDLLHQRRFSGVHTYNRTEHLEVLDAQRPTRLRHYT